MSSPSESDNDPDRPVLSVADKSDNDREPAGTPDLPPGITLEDRERVRSYLFKDLSESTRRVYNVQWEQFTEWCEGRGTPYLPAHPEVVGAYLTERGPDRSSSWIGQAAAAIRRAHQQAGLRSPTDAPGLKQMITGLKNEHGSPATPKTAARTDHIRHMVEAIRTPKPEDGAGPARRAGWLRALRNEALLLLGYAAALRRSELAAVRREHVTFNPKGLELLIPRSKGDQEGEGRTVGVNYLDQLCPVTAVQKWMSAAAIEAGPIFRAVPNTARVAPDHRATSLSGQAVRNVVRSAAEAAGLDGDDYAGHSLRRGHLTEAAMNGADLKDLQRQARHADPRTTAEYIEDANRMETNTSTRLGL
jgi:site-specific recombinase XerD